MTNYTGSDENIVISDSVTSIGEWAFLFCDKLIISCIKDRVVEKYAIENDIEYVNVNNK